MAWHIEKQHTVETVLFLSFFNDGAKETVHSTTESTESGTPALVTGQDVIRFSKHVGAWANLR
jgi:hypothetical protein